MFGKVDKWGFLSRSYFFNCVFLWNGLGRWVIYQLGKLKAVVDDSIDLDSVVLLCQP